MDESLEIEADGDKFILRRTDANGAVSQMELSEDNILTLARSTPPMMEQILAVRSRAGLTASSVTPVARIRLANDIHLTEIFLELHDRHGGYATFALSPRQAQVLAEHLPAWIAKATHSPKTTQ
jgi:hypothetical protein